MLKSRLNAGNWMPVEKLIAIEIDEVDCKKAPKCHSIVAEIMRGSEAVRSKELVISTCDFPVKVGCKKMTMMSKFFVDKEKVQDKTLEFRVSALNPGNEDIVLGSTNINIAKFYDLKQQNVKLDIRGDFFTVHTKISVIDIDQGITIGLDHSSVTQFEESALQKKVRQLEERLAKAHDKSVSYISKSEVHVESESQKRELEACHAKIKNQSDRMEQLEQENCHLKEENQIIVKDNKHQESMVHELQKKFEEAAKEADAKAEKEVEEFKKIARESSVAGKHVEISFSYNMSLQGLINQCSEAMNAKHALDQHRIHQLQQRIFLLERQAQLDYEREANMIEKWQISVALEVKMRADVYKLNCNLTSLEHEVRDLKDKCFHLECEITEWENNYKKLEIQCTEYKHSAEHWEKKCKETEEKLEKKSEECDKWEKKYKKMKEKRNTWKCEAEKWKLESENWEGKFNNEHIECEKWEAKFHAEHKRAEGLEQQVKDLEIKLAAALSNDQEDAAKISHWQSKFEQEEKAHKETTIKLELQVVEYKKLEVKFENLDKEYHELKKNFAELLVKFEKLEKEHNELIKKYESLKIKNLKLQKDLDEMTEKHRLIVISFKDSEHDRDQWKYKHTEIVVINKNLITDIEEHKITIINLQKNDAQDSEAIAYWKKRAEKFKKKYKGLKDDYQKLKEKYDESCKKNTSFEVEINVHIEKYTALTVTQQTWEADYHKEHKAYNGILLKLKECEEKLATALADDEDDSAEIASLKKQVKELQVKYNSEYTRAEKYEEKNSALEMDLKNQKEKVEELEIELEHEKKIVKGLREQVEGLEDSQDQLKKQIRNLERDLTAAKEDAQKWELKYKKACEDDRSDDKKIQDLTARQDELEDEIDTLKNKCDRLERENEDLLEKCNRQEKQLKEQRNFEGEMKFYKEKYDHIVSESKSWEIKYHASMKNNRVLKEKHTTLKVKVKAKGNAVSSSSSSSSDSD